MASIPNPTLYIWPQPAPAQVGWPPTTPTRIMISQQYNQQQGVYIGNFLAGPNCPDGFASGTEYTLYSSTPFTGPG